MLSTISREEKISNLLPASLYVGIKKVSAIIAQMDAAKWQFENEINNFQGVDLNLQPLNDAAKGAGSDSADAFLEEFEKELEKLQDLRDRGKITEKEYLDQLRVNVIALYCSNTVWKK